MWFKFMRMLRSLDNFGHPIQLNYKGNETYQSACGGLLTIAVQVITLIASISALTEVFGMKDPKITSYTRPLTEEDRDDLGVISF